MGLFQRVGDIVSANLNEMIERYEDPEKMLKQAVREMESSIAVARVDVAKAIANERLLTRRLEENKQQAAQWQAHAATAVAAGDEGLARKALARKQEHARIAAALADEHAAALEASQTLRRQLDAMQAKLAEANRRLGTLAARQKAADLKARAELARLDPHWNTDAFARFERLQEKVDLAEAEADALRELCHDRCAPADFSAAEPVDAEVEAELLELQEKLAG